MKPTLDPYMIEYAMEHCFHSGLGRKKRDYIYNFRFIEPLLKAGYVEEIAKADYSKYQKIYDPEGDANTHWYRPTPDGLVWWIGERAAEYERTALEHPNSGRPLDPAILYDSMCGKGIGSETKIYLGPWNAGAVFVALREGILEFVSHSDYSGMPRACSENITVKLTGLGMAFFDALPRLELECA